VPVELGRAADETVLGSAAQGPADADAVDPTVDPIADPVAGLLGDLGRWSGRTPLVLHVADGVIRSVESQPWAAPLDPEDWTGLGIDELPIRLGARIGAPSEPVVEQRGSLSTSRTRFGTDADVIEFRAVVDPGPTGRDLRVAVATDADLAEAGRGAR
jgi:hypothetical protein